MLVDLHPGRRAPGRRPDFEGRIHLLGGQQERQQVAFIPFHREMLQVEIAFDIVIGIILQCEVAGADRGTGHRQVGADARSEQFPENGCPLRFRQCFEGLPAQFAGSGSEPFHRLEGRSRINDDRRLRRIRPDRSGILDLPGLLEGRTDPLHFFLRTGGQQEGCRQEQNCLFHIIGFSNHQSGRNSHSAGARRRCGRARGPGGGSGSRNGWCRPRPCPPGWPSG